MIWLQQAYIVQEVVQDPDKGLPFGYPGPNTPSLAPGNRGSKPSAATGNFGRKTRRNEPARQPTCPYGVGRDSAELKTGIENPPMIDRRSFLSSAAGLGLGHTHFGQAIDFLFGRERKKSRRRWNELTDLDAILHKDPPIMREVARTYIRRATRQAANGKPLTGSYYCAPIPMRRQRVHRDGVSEEGRTGMEWTVFEFFDCWLPCSDHSYVWKHVLDSMRQRWKLPFPLLSTECLPRGRVRRIPKSPGGPTRLLYVIDHGADYPQGFAGLNLVRKLFNLAQATPAVCVEHETVVALQASHRWWERLGKMHDGN